MYDAFVIHQVADGQQGEQHGQAQEDELQRAVTFQGAEEHEQGEYAPQTQVNAQEMRVCRVCQAHFRQQQNGNQRQPERAVRGKGG